MRRKSKKKKAIEAFNNLISKLENSDNHDEHWKNETKQYLTSYLGKDTQFHKSIDQIRFYGLMPQKGSKRDVDFQPSYTHKFPSAPKKAKKILLDVIEYIEQNGIKKGEHWFWKLLRTIRGGMTFNVKNDI